MFDLAATSGHVAYNVGITAAAHPDSSSLSTEHFAWRKITRPEHRLTTASSGTTIYTGGAPVFCALFLFNLRHPRDVESTSRGGPCMYLFMRVRCSYSLDVHRIQWYQLFRYFRFDSFVGTAVTPPFSLPPRCLLFSETLPNRVFFLLVALEGPRLH